MTVPGRTHEPARRSGRASRPRRTQEERSAETRSRLLDATIACLVDLGYARTTTTEVSDRAGLSRGAQLHHFPTKAELVTSAVEHLFARRLAEFRAAFATPPPVAERAAACIDLLWTMFSGPTFYAWLELAVASRTDSELRRSLQVVSQHFLDDVHRTFHDLFPASSGAANPLFATAPWMTFAVMEGLALGRIVETDGRRAGAVLDALKTLATLITPA